MRDMTEKEIRDFITDWTWGTLIAVDGDEPYAIEVTYGTDGEYIYCGSRPGGEMAKCIKANKNVIFKICNADRAYVTWKAATVKGKAEKLIKKEDILHGIRLIAKRRSTNERVFDGIAERIAKDPENGNAIRIAIKNISGVVSG